MDAVYNGVPGSMPLPRGWSVTTCSDPISFFSSILGVFLEKIKQHFGKLNEIKIKMCFSVSGLFSANLYHGRHTCSSHSRRCVVPLQGKSVILKL